MKNFGKRIKARREELCLSQQRVAELCDLSRTSVAKIEGGTQTPNLDTVIALARALNTTVGILIGEAPQVAALVPAVNVVAYFGVECSVCGVIRITRRDRREAERIRKAHSVPHPLPLTAGEENAKSVPAGRVTVPALESSHRHKLEVMVLA